MTGYQSKKAAALDKLEQWDTPNEAFNDWWDSDYGHGQDGKQHWHRRRTMEREALKLAQEPASVTYKEVQDSMNALEKGNLYQQVIAEELGQRKLYTTAPAAQPAQENK